LSAVFSGKVRFDCGEGCSSGNFFKQAPDHKRIRQSSASLASATVSFIGFSCSASTISGRLSTSECWSGRESAISSVGGSGDLFCEQQVVVSSTTARGDHFYKRYMAISSSSGIWLSLLQAAYGYLFYRRHMAISSTGGIWLSLLQAASGDLFFNRQVAISSASGGSVSTVRVSLCTGLLDLLSVLLCTGLLDLLSVLLRTGSSCVWVPSPHQFHSTLRQLSSGSNTLNQILTLAL
jgi:hypothetical protein